MTLLFDTVEHVDSPIRRFDPRWKFVAFTLCIFLIAGMQVWYVLLLTCGFTFCLLLFAKVRLSWYMQRLSYLLPILGVLLVVFPFILHKDGLPWYYFSLRGFVVAVSLSLRALAMLSMVLILFFSTPLPLLLQAAHCLYVPGILIQIAALSYRYLFLLIEEFKRLRTALRLRGFRNRGNLHSYHTIGNVMAILLVRSSERGERVGQAMRCRGFNGRFHTTHPFRTRLNDVGLFVILVTITSMLFAWDYWVSG